MTTVYLVINVIVFYISGSSGEKLRKCLFCFKQQTEHSGFTGRTVTTEYRVSLLFLTDLSRLPDSVTQAVTSWLFTPLFPILETSDFPYKPSVHVYHSTSGFSFHQTSSTQQGARWLCPAPSPCSRPAVSPLAYSIFPSALISSTSSSELQQVCYCIYYLLMYGGARDQLCGTVLAWCT